MPQEGKQEKQFFQALRDVFVGARVEGESGFVNLMGIKTRYYENGVFPRLKKDIDEALKPFPEFREELFDRLYNFFKRYFSESGSVYFRFTPPHEHVYEKVYTDDRDVALFWKTHILYYVKTDRLFRSMAVEVDGFRFFFDVSALEHKRANEKRTLVYAFKERQGDGTLALSVAYSERGRQTDLAGIRRAIKEALGLSRYTSQVPSEETLERAFRLFERQSEVDYFINKDARRFLQEQFNLWLYQYVFEPEEQQGTVWTERRVRQLQVLKEIAYRIIDFIGQFEEELVRVWNKPKFVLGSHYVITLDRIAGREGGMEVLERLLAHPGMAAQVEEWRELGMVGEDFTPEQVWVTDLMGKRLHERYQYLPLDTKHFPDPEMAIIALFDHLDQELDGWLVHSENYQALNTLLPKFRERVKTVYIDPPYNTGNDDFIYNDRFRHSSWLTMMENRLRLAREWMREDGAIFVNIDDTEQAHLKKLLELVFGDQNFLENFVWNNTATPPSLSRISRRNVEYILAFRKTAQMTELLGRPGEGNDAPLLNRGNPLRTICLPPKSVRFLIPDGRYMAGNRKRVRLIKDVEVVDGTNVTPLYLECESKWTQETIEQEVQRGTLFLIKSEDFSIRYLRSSQEWIPPDKYIDPQFLSRKAGVPTNESARKELEEMGVDFPSYPKPLGLALFFVRSAVNKEGFVLDFFAGSGTTGHAVINLNREDGGRRRYILVEVNDYFHTVLLPRIKKVVFSDKWRDGKAQPEGKGISHFVKYFRLEQYEEVLRRAHYQDDEAPLFVQDDPYTQYVFLRDPKMLDNAETGERVMEVNLERNEIRVDLSKLYPDIDLAESLSCLTGKWIRRIHPAQDDPTRPGRVEFEDGTAVDLQNPPWERVKPLIWW
ncbi:DNA methylase [Thermus filiformis]|uniref:DNA methylase n=1 Tax=Thermus filiformis TaxID=276 RepID=A0A0A2WRB0_THEFI|nr:DNA methylase [Thermus filiformis]